MSTNGSEVRSSPWWRYTTRDLVVMAILSVVAAIAYAVLGQVWAALTTATGPLGGAFLGLFQFGHLIAFAVVRRPGCAFVTSVTSTVIQVFMGDPAGIYVIGWGVTHGIGAEAIFAASRYRAPSWWMLALAGGVGAVCGHLWSFTLYGWEAAMSLFYLSIPVLFVSSAVESGLLAYGVYRIVVRALRTADDQPR